MIFYHKVFIQLQGANAYDAILECPAHMARFFVSQIQVRENIGVNIRILIRLFQRT